MSPGPLGPGHHGLGAASNPFSVQEEVAGRGLRPQHTPITQCTWDQTLPLLLKSHVLSAPLWTC